MQKDIVAKRYAKALLQLAAAASESEKVKADIVSIADMYKASKSLQDVIMNPVYSTDDKQKVVAAMLGGMDVSKLTARFAEVLIEKRRFRFVREVAAAYSDLLDQMQGRIKATLTSATPLEDSELAKIKAKVAAMVGKDVELTVDVDPALIGGLKTRVGGTIYDGSLSNQVKLMREALVK